MAMNPIEQEIRRGLSKLVCLSLDHTPAMDMLEGTVSAWCSAITYRKVWTQADMPRFVEAFGYLLQNCSHWPSPQDFLQAMPGPPSEAEKARALEVLPPADKRAQLQLVSESSGKAAVEIAKITELLRVNLTLSREEEERRELLSKHVDHERPWGVDVDEWERRQRS